MTTPSPDSHIAKAQRNADQAELDQENANAQESAKPTHRNVHVDTKAVMPEHAQAFTLVTSTSVNPIQQLLPRDPNRRRAVIVTLDEPIVIASSYEMASDPRNSSNTAGQAAAGLVWPVNSSLTVESRGPLWVAATSATATRVSVLVETYEADGQG